MAIKKYVADADTTIVNAFQSNLETRGTGANCGEADILETFSIYGRETTASAELSRILIKFPVADISTDRTAGIIPASGNVSFYLKLYNAETSKTVPRDYTLSVLAVSQSWQEGTGLDLEGYKDLTFSKNVGSNWMSASNAADSYWKDISNTLLAGGSYHTGASGHSPGQEIHLFTQDFTTGLENLELDITPLVEQWMASDAGDGTSGDGWPNYGVGIHMSQSFEAFVSGADDPRTSRLIDVPDPATSGQSVIYNPSGSTKSYFTKRFFARGTQYFFKKPVIEARWNDSRQDDRGQFYYSSSLAPAEDNLNTLYFYNYVRGKLTDIPALGVDKRIYVSLCSGNYNNTAPSSSGIQVLSPDGSGLASQTYGVRTAYPTVVTGGIVSTGIYSCSFAFTGSSDLTHVFDVWWTGSEEVANFTSLDGDGADSIKQFFTGSIIPKTLEASEIADRSRYYLNITNLRDKYRKDETARFNLYIRNKDWSPTIYSKANKNIETTTIFTASYRVYRVLDGYDAISYGTGSDKHTVMSYDVSGNYFDLDMSLLEPGYQYAFKISFYDAELSSWLEQPYNFKFRVEEYEY